MSLQNQILKVLSDNENKTPKDIYKQIIKDNDYFFTVMNPETSIKNLCLRMYKKELIECQVKDNVLHYYIPLPPEREEISEEEEKQKIVEYIVYYEEERNKIASEQKIKKNQYRNTVIIFILSLVAFGFNYYN
mgnify:CR=1 FL=1